MSLHFIPQGTKQDRSLKVQEGDESASDEDVTNSDRDDMVIIFLLLIQEAV